MAAILHIPCPKCGTFDHPPAARRRERSGRRSPRRAEWRGSRPDSSARRRSVGTS